MVKKVISVTGDHYHQGDELRQYIQEVLGLLEASVDYEDIALEDLADALAKNPDLVIFSTQNQQTPQEDDLNHWLTPELGKLITAYVDHGGSWLALHSGMANYPTDSDYIKMLKGYFTMHPEPLPVTYRSDLPDTPSEFTIVDEHYQVAMVDEFTHIFLRSFSDYGESVAGWRHFYGSGKVVGYVPAHYLEGMLHQDNLAVLKNVIAWSLKHQSSVRWKQYLCPEQD
jgi:hypothetical protein